MKAVIAYGTGRGTTGKLAEAIAAGLASSGVSAVAISIEYLTAIRLQQADLIGIGSPVHFYREARYVTNFLATLPRLDGKRAFAFCTSGMDRPGETLSRLYATLVERGAVVVGLERFRSAMSYAPLRRRGLGNSESLPDAAVYRQATEFGERMAQADRLPPVDVPKVSWLLATKARLLAHRRVRGLFFPGIRLNASLCTGYGQCMSRCLVNGLERRDGRTIPDVTEGCVRCLECVAWCPRAAIEPDSRVKDWLTTVSYRLGIH
ncbi:flavodoxin domain-containing protein [Candidatus Nitrospira bockiana]